jgi:transmembrane sensor
MSKVSRHDQHRQEISHVAAQAADWIRIVKGPDFSDEERERFLKWVKESPLHVKELLMAYATYGKLNRMDAGRQIDIDALISQITSNVRPIGPHALRAVDADEPRARSVLIAKIAAAIVLVAIPFYIFMFHGKYSTDAGEQLRASLSDGSGVYLNSLSRVRVSFSDRARDVYLERGQALFEVENDPKRPFRVHAGNSVIQALGTQFDVRLLHDGIRVAVVEGAVQVSASREVDHSTNVPRGSAPAKLSAGESTSINALGHIAQPVRVDVDAAVGWWQQQLVFERTPLAQVAEEFNRYNRLQLRIEGDAVARKRFNGVFGSRKPESFLAYLAKDDGLVFERRGDEVIIRER